MPDLDTCVIDGVAYEAVDSEPRPGRLPGCGNCAGMVYRICRRLPPCSPHCGREDNKHKTWRRAAAAETGKGGAA